MATLSQGITVTWGSVTFAEVTDLQVSYGGSSPVGRSKPWSADAGTVSVACFGSTGISASLFGLRDELTISGGGVSLTCNAIYEGWTAAPEVNGVTRFTVNFKLLDG